MPCCTIRGIVERICCKLSTQRVKVSGLPGSRRARRSRNDADGALNEAVKAQKAAVQLVGAPDKIRARIRELERKAAGAVAFDLREAARGPNDNSGIGAAWVFVQPTPPSLQDRPRPRQQRPRPRDSASGHLFHQGRRRAFRGAPRFLPWQSPRSEFVGYARANLVNRHVAPR
jgi:hypothetical protein